MFLIGLGFSEHHKMLHILCLAGTIAIVQCYQKLTSFLPAGTSAKHRLSTHSNIYTQKQYYVHILAWY